MFIFIVVNALKLKPHFEEI